MTRHKSRHPDSPFAPNLHRAQALAGLTNEELARKADVSLRLLQKWRAGQAEPTIANLMKIAGVLDRELEWFFNADGDGSTEDAA